MINNATIAVTIQKRDYITVFTVCIVWLTISDAKESHEQVLDIGDHICKESAQMTRPQGVSRCVQGEGGRSVQIKKQELDKRVDVG